METGDRRDRLENIASITQGMRSSLGNTPDFAASILVAVDERRSFLSGRDRRRVLLTRAALGISVATLALGAALIHRFAPDAVELVAQPQPMSSMISCVECEASSRVKTIRASLGEVAESPAPRLSNLVSSVASPVKDGLSIERRLLGNPAGSGTLADSGGSGGENLELRLTAGCFVGPVRPCLKGACRERGTAVSEGADAGRSGEPVRVVVRMRRDLENRGTLAVEPPRMLWMSATRSDSRSADRGVSFRAIAPLASGVGEDESMIPK